ncbi:hypothetical protein [Helicobacter bizzozeronii]|uniref:hypothetical protein n=1 Tax=Helicobacter bizzozeronii TaxID=56877 RepID=UPI0018F81254|nr:hypothetical protein [Helicobacter bizzozeronii]
MYNGVVYHKYTKNNFSKEQAIEQLRINIVSTHCGYYFIASKSLVSSVVSGIKSAISAVGSALKSVASGIKSVFSAVVGAFS